MLTNLLIAFVLMAACVAIHAFGLMAMLRWVQARPARATHNFRLATWILIRVAGKTIALHILQIFAWACVYVAGGAIAGFTSAAYFSSVTYTTTGYGDIVLPQDWRLVGGVEALTGIMMCGLSTGMFFSVFSKIFLPSEDHRTS